jgi:hypothetical protein
VREQKSFIVTSLPRGTEVRVEVEASGHARWFERLLAEVNFELWIGDATETARKRERQAEDGSAGCAASPSTTLESLFHV